MFETGFPSHWSTIKKLIWLRMILSSGGSTGQYVTVTGSSPLALVNSLAHALASLTRYGLCEQRNLPKGYTQLDYIEGNGTAYIDTGVLLSNTDVFEITFQSLNALASPVMGAISGGTSYTSTNNLSVTYTINAGLSAYSVYCDGAAGNVDYSWNGGNRADGLKHTIKYNGLNIAPMLDGVAMTQVTSHTLVENTPTVTTWLFGRNSTSTGTLAQSGVRIFDFNIQSKGHFIPARRNSDNVVGMYDLVTGQFFTNAGTGSFTAGPVATPTPDSPVDIMTNNGAIKVRRQSGLPLGYQRVAWIKPTGGIPITGFKTKSTQEITTVFYRESRGSAYLYASDTATSGSTNTTAYLTSGGGNWRWDGNAASINVPTGIKVTSIQKKEGVWLNGTKSGSYTTAGDFVSTNDLRLSSSENTTVRIESQTIREGEVVTLDLVPVQRLSDSAYGFFDKVSGTFHTNPEATFEAGDPIDDPVEIYTDGEGEVLTVRGKNLFDCATVGVVQGSIGNETGTELDSDYRVRTGFVLVKPNTTYTASAVISGYIAQSSNGLYLFEYSSAEQRGLIQTSGWQNPSGYTFTTGATTNYIRFVFAISSRTAITPSAVSNIQLEKGDTATTYEPYVTPQTVTGIPMLLSTLDESVRDEVELVNGPKTVRVGVYAVKGTDDEAWTKATQGSTSNVMFYMNTGGPARAGDANTLCTVAKGGANQWTSSPDKIVVRNNRNFGFINPTGFTNDSTVEDFQAAARADYLAGKPWIIVYAAYTELAEQTTPHSLHSYNGTTIVEAQTNVDPVELDVEYYASQAPNLLFGGFGNPNADEPGGGEETE